MAQVDDWFEELDAMRTRLELLEEIASGVRKQRNEILKKLYAAGYSQTHLGQRAGLTQQAVSWLVR
jgi:hypothetical protein